METTGNKYLHLQNLLICVLYLSCSFLFHHVTGDVALDCGSSANSTEQPRGRAWTADPDQGGYLLKSQNDTVVATKPEAPIPYSTARLSYSEFTYSFSVNAGQKFIRLHFYPTLYQNFDSSKAFFSVKAGSFNLLRNFSALLNSPDQREEDSYFSREFCVNIGEQEHSLNITFTPVHEMPGAFAFINGIEIVSMPLNLYYSAPNASGFKYVAQLGLYRIEAEKALQLMYRIRAGGNYIPPIEDTANMYRSWSPDDEYLTDRGVSGLPVNFSINLNFSIIPNYAAPQKLYTSARTMTGDKELNLKSNLTWEFQVDSGFNYFIRLHFCEFESPINDTYDRMFFIYMNDQIAEEQASVIKWTGATGVPYYKDYAVMIGVENSKRTKQDLSIAMHPNPIWKSRYSNAILNGLEIFKVSNALDLFAPNPDPVSGSLSPGVPTSTQSSTEPKNNRTIIIGIVAGVLSGFVVLLVMGFLILRRKMARVKDAGSSDGGSWWGPFSFTTNKSKSSKSRGSQLPSDLCRYFSLSEIKTATNNFDDVFIVGVGGFGNVYKGYIDDASTPVAIKRLNPGSQQGAHEFQTEIEMLSQLRHVHLVSLIGYCNDDREMILVYDYMTHGTLRDHLYNTENPPLSWNQRLQISIGAAKGLHYLHSGAKRTIIHRDVKTTNILLDDKWVAKVSDFGLSKMGPTGVSKAHVSTVVKGSFGYVDPEYYRRQQLTEKSDVYSFGVVLFEVLCARPPINRKVDKRQVSLAEWARQCYHNGVVDQIIDPFLRGKIAPECLKKFSEVAMNCLNEDGIERPSMSDVVWGLEFALQLQDSAEQQIIKLGGALLEDDDQVVVDEKTIALFKDDYTTEDSCDAFSSIGEHVLNSSGMTITTTTASQDSDQTISGAVFSQINNSQGR